MQKILVANMLRHWPETVEMIQKEPRGRYEKDKYNNHPFIRKVNKAILHSGITKEIFDEWVKSVRHGFIWQNAISMPKQLLKEIGYKDAFIDARSFLEQQEANTKQ